LPELSIVRHQQLKIAVSNVASFRLETEMCESWILWIRPESFRFKIS